jgi:adenylate cyclase
MKRLWIGTWGIFVAILLTLPAIQAWDERVWSRFLQFRGNRLPPAEVVIIAIDGESLEAGETILKDKMGPWVWKRAAYAEVIERLFASGARVVALDILFSSPSLHGKEDDRRFQQVLNRYSDRLVLAASYENSQNPQSSISQLITPQSNFRIPANSVGMVKYAVNSLEQVSHLNQTSDSQIRTFAEATMGATGKQIKSNANNRINYFGAADTWLNASQQRPFFYLLDPQNWRVLEKEKFFENKIVLIGATADSLQDFQTSPFGRMSGVEVNANAIATLLEDSAIRPGIENIWSQSVLVGLLVVGAGTLACKFQRPLWQFSLNILLAISWVIFSYTLFVSQHITLPVALPLAAIALQGLALDVIGTITIQRERSALRRTLEQYVAAPIVNEILSQPEAYRQLLQGKTVEAAVLFCDIRGFTNLCHQLPAGKLIAQLNSYLGEMVEAILEMQGTVDKFIGDEVMAEFGTPISQGTKTDVLNSVKAALAMRNRLVGLRQKWNDAKETPFFHGIGIHYGEITVGNIGSPKRLEYAAIGDTVNLASRVQSMTKDLGVDILITSSIYQFIKDEVEVIEMGEHQVRGRSLPVKLYALVELKGNDAKLFQEIRTQMQNYLQPSPHVDGLSS